MLNRVRNDVFIFLRYVGKEGSAYSKAMEDTVFQITDARFLSRVIEGIDEISSDGADMMGDVYEYMLGIMAASGTNGQFRTPRHIIRMMVELMRPTLDDTICDPAMGSAGFIMEAAKYITEHQSDELLNIEEKERFRKEIFHGSDSDASMLRIGCMNMMLHDVDEPNLYYRNSLSDENDDTNRYTLCLANPPFAGSLDTDDIAHTLKAAVKTKKTELVSYIKEKEGVELNPDSIFDIQVKRLHEYKRQQMNALYIIHKYLEIKGGKKPSTPLTFIFGAKAAPAYVIAQDIIHLLLVMSDIINNDPEVSPYMKLVMVENYNVSYAEKLIPACDISEQISLASKEASGTGNMKFMLNGAVTLGTSDGANVEIHELVGDDNIYIFGKDSDTVIKHYEKADYVSKDYYKKSPVIKEAVDFIVSKEVLKVGKKENLERLYNELLNKDWFMTLLDLEDYIKVKDQAFADYEDQQKWKKMMLVNIAKAGFFSSDRTIAEYNRDIWKLK